MKRRTIFASILCIFTMLFLLPAVTASAENTSLKSMELRVVNPPEGDYLIDLLIATPRTEALPDALDPNDRAELTLRAYNHDGWVARCAGLNGEDYFPVRNSADHIYKYNNVIPEQFRVIIVTADGKTMVSSKITPILYNTTVTFDAVSGALTESVSDAKDRFVAGILAMWPNFGITLGVTVAVEALVMALFFLKWGWRGWLKFVPFQILTHALMYLFLLICRLLGALYDWKLLIAAGAMFLIEALLYDRFIETKFRGRMTFAALIANAASGAVIYCVPFLLGMLP